jgi:hypothetical protein
MDHDHHNIELLDAIKIMKLFYRKLIVPKGVVYGNVTYYFLNRNGIVYVSIADSCCFPFLHTVAKEFEKLQECNISSTRPYALMKLEPWLTKLKLKYSRIISSLEDDVMVVELESLVGIKPKPKPILNSNKWNQTVMGILLMTLFTLDLLFGYQYGYPMKSYNTLSLLTLILFIFSPVYLILVYLLMCKKSFDIMKSIVTCHLVLVFLQILHTILFPRPEYKKPLHQESLTTLQQWATFFDSFSIPVVVIFIKLVYIQFLLVQGYTYLMVVQKLRVE